MNIFKWLASFFSKPPRPENTGIVLGPHSGAAYPTAYVVGSTSIIPYAERLSSGDWTPYTWSQVKQWCIKNGTYYDQLSCTTNALLNSIEAQEFFLTGKKVSYSRRWVAKMSGTNQGSLKGIGNYMDMPAEWVRKNGLVLDSSYPTPDTYTVDEFYSDINPVKANELAFEGMVWKTKWGLSYEFLQVSDPNLDYHLKHAPITVVIPGHDICGVYSPNQLMNYRDSYEPWDKQTTVGNLQAALKAILTPKSLESGFVKWNNSPEVWFMAKMDSMQRLEKFKNTFTNYDPDFFVKDGISYLPAKKPF